MPERTDGHRPNTAKVSKPLAAVSGIVTESKVQTAYRAYLDHARDCEDCPQSAFQCDAAAALWRAYKEARG
jgi:hypothetical protein